MLADRLRPLVEGGHIFVAHGAHPAGLQATLTLGRGEVTFGGEGRWDHSHFENWLTTNRIRDAAQQSSTSPGRNHLGRIGGSTLPVTQRDSETTTWHGS